MGQVDIPVRVEDLVDCELANGCTRNRSQLHNNDDDDDAADERGESMYDEPQMPKSVAGERQKNVKKKTVIRSKASVNSR